ncbi:uncharacterized protein LOC134786298 [Penaeus indicus]|uniref:uncharacterized protein LOC134786298 n=1 Tax=Penaeus indicus TaxID=29960 RepID=UPI00300D19E2
MFYILLLYFVVQGAGAKSSWECIALDGERVRHGETFVPGPDMCTVCRCEEGKAHLCQAVLCQPPQDCKSFRIGALCCDFICLDDILPKIPDGKINPSTDLGLRMVASAVTAILSLALLLFLIHRLRQRRLRAQQQYYEDQLDSPVGPSTDACHNNACCHNAAYCNGNDHAEFFVDSHTPPYLWKPPSFYFPHDDAPPPYSEVVGSSYRLSETNGALPSLGPLMVQLGPPPGESSDLSDGVLPLVDGASSNGTRMWHSPVAGASTRNIDGAHGIDVTLRSDEVYEDHSGIPSDLPPPYHAASEPLNDLNRGTQTNPLEPQSRCNETRCRARTTPEEGPSSSSVPEPTVCRNNNNNVHQQPQQQQQEQQHASSEPAVRLRSHEHRSSVVLRDGERTSTMEEFQLRLSMDISDSSTSSDGPTRTFSSSSEDSTSMDASEMH